MDIDTTIHELVALARAVEENRRAPEDAFDDLERMAELVSAADEWFAKGGYLPHRWRNADRG